MSFRQAGLEKGRWAGGGKGAGPGTSHRARHKVSNKDPVVIQSPHNFAIVDITLLSMELQKRHCTDISHSLSP